MKVWLYFIMAMAVGALHAQTPMFTCSNAQSLTLTGTTAAGNVQLVAAPSLGRGANVYICSYSVQVTEGAMPYSFQLTAGTGTACATNNTPLTVSATGAASSMPSIGAVFTSDAAVKVPANNAVCLTLGGAVTTSSVNIRWVTY